MGICYGDKSLVEAVNEKEQLFKETGFAYGLEKLDLVESDPAKFMRFQMRLVAACINARETAKLVSANPMSMIQGELLFMLANPEGDVVSASYGLAGHIQAFPFIIRSIADLGFEEDPGIRYGDIFASNDALYGPPHNADNYTWLPLFYEDELIGWTVGLNHIVDVGGIQPGGLGTISTSVFTDGFTYPPLKTGENFKQHKWWELQWKRRTRTELFNVLDDKMRAAGVVVLHDRILEIVDEFGIDYYRKGMRELIERERRVLIDRIKMQSVPGKYDFLHLSGVNYKGVVGKLWTKSNRNWILHIPSTTEIRPDGTLYMDCEGLTSEDDFYCNTYESCVRMTTTCGCWPMFAYTETINSSLLYMTDWNLPPGSMFNPQNPYAATVMGIAEASKYTFMFHQVLSYAYFARGFLEESFPQDAAGVGYGLMGVLGDGFPWAGGDMCLITCWSQMGLPYRDGFASSVCTPNPASDMGEAEITEFLQPTNCTMGRKLLPDYCGHGKFRGGLGSGICHLINEPGQSLTAAVFSSSGAMGRLAVGMCGGYTGPNDVVYFAHDTNLKELLAQGHSYPRDFVEVTEWVNEGKLKVGSLEVYRHSSPNVNLKDGDIMAAASSSRGGWGDVLERPYDLIEEDLKYGWITPYCAREVYGTVADSEGKVDTEESDRLRNQLRARRRERSVDAKHWWKQERELVMRKNWFEEVYNMFADNCKYNKFRTQFYGMWQLSEDYAL